MFMDIYTLSASPTVIYGEGNLIKNNVDSSSVPTVRKAGIVSENNCHFLWCGVGERTVLEETNSHTHNFIRNSGVTYMLGSVACLITWLSNIMDVVSWMSRTFNKTWCKYCIVAYYCGKCSSQKAHKYSLKQKKLLSRDRGNVNQDVGIYLHIL